MPNPDAVTQYLASRGATPSAENASRVRQHFASNPDNLDRRAAGLPGGLDDNSAVLDAMLDRHMQDTALNTATDRGTWPVPEGKVTVGQPEQIPPPSRTGPAVKGPKEVGGTVSRQGNYGPGPSPSRQANYDNGPSASGKSTSSPNLTGDVLYGSGSQVGDTKHSDFTNWLLTAAAALAGGYGLSKMGGAAPAPAPAAAGGALPGMTPPAAATAATQAPTNTDQDVMKARMQAEIDAENDAMTRKMAEDAAKQRNQRNTEDLARAARRATGRR